MPKPLPFTYVRVTWPTKILNWLLYGSTTVHVLICLLIGAAFSGIVASISWVFAGSLSEQLVMYALLAVFIAFMFLLFCHGLLRIMGEQILMHISGPDALRRMSAGALEQLSLALFEAQGHKVRVRALPGKPDGGIDLEILRNGQRGLVQCKKYTYDSVGVDKVREFYGVMVDSEADFGIFITTSNFTDEAEKFAFGKPIELVNHAALWDMVEKYQLQEVLDKALATPKLEIVDGQPLLCPRCGDTLVLRHSHRGPFLGCSSYYSTGCRTIVPLGKH